MKRILGATVALAVLAIFISSAQAAIKIEVVEVQNGFAFVKGKDAARGAQITWDGNAVTTANTNNGGFSFNGAVPDDCIGVLSDGVDTINVEVFDCTPVNGGGGEVAATGQTICYDSGGAPVDCTGTGQDGEYQAGTPLPSPRFTDNLNGTVTDNLTGLIWLQNADCFGARTWADALADANGLADLVDDPDCGLNDGSIAGDWRLPNVRELQSLIHYGFSVPALSNTAGTAKWTTNGEAFNNVTSFNYWSSTTFEGLPNGAWTVLFSFGIVSGNDKTVSVFVLPVRGP